MSADRERTHDMADSDITLLLADAADEVEIGIAPYEAVVRGGRRRRARRWAVATATALVIVGTSATVALAGLADGGGGRVEPMSTPTPTHETRNVRSAQQDLLGVGTVDGKDWYVTVDVWEAPKNDVEGQAQLNAMAEHGEHPVDVREGSQLVGKTSYFVHRSIGDDTTPVTQNTITKADALSSTDLMAAALPLEPGSDGPERLVVGRVAKTTQQVTCTWKDGTSTKIHRVPAGYDVNSDDQVIRPMEGSLDNWFVCVAPEGTAYKSVKVTK